MGQTQVQKGGDAVQSLLITERVSQMAHLLDLAECNRECTRQQCVPNAIGAFRNLCQIL